MHIEDHRILDILDEECRTMADIRRRLNCEIASMKVSKALERLVNAGTTEKRFQADFIARARGGMA